jgi:hypothetical protein
MFEIKGETTEEKFKVIERTLQRFSRKLHRTVVGVMPPIPIFFEIESIPETGVVFKCLIPTSGVITNVCLYIREFEGKTTVPFRVESHGTSVGTFADFRTRKNLTVDEVNISVSPGDMLTFSTTEPERVRGIWASFLFQMGIKDMKKEKFLIEDFERLIEEGNDG